jgi:hypothetical protein|tara:strand:- start:3658 stop:4008 length:351 start_codon:yes stop_codon:yes gene_type:complete
MNFNNCKDCGEKLKAVHHLRTSPKLCSKCRTWSGGGNKQTNELRELYKELVKNPTQVSEDEMFFDDDPRAEKENDYGRVSKASSVISSWGTSALSEMMTMSDTNKHRHKNVFAKDK